MGSNPSPGGETVGQAVRRVAQILKAVGIDEAAGDSRKLVAASLQASTAAIIRDPALKLTREQASQLDKMVSRRAAREPVSRILGWREFYGRQFAVTPAVLDPRPDTETLIDAAIDIGGLEGWPDRAISILDIGTGSGAILLTLLAQFPLSRGLGIDISGQALEVASANANALGLSSRAKFEQRDILAGFPMGYDLAVSNPPYIPSVEISELDPEVALFDPHLALDGGTDGLDFYRSIITAWAPAAKKTQWLLLEAGAGQSTAIERIAEKAGLFGSQDHVRRYRDLGRHIRCVAIEAQFASR